MYDQEPPEPEDHGPIPGSRTIEIRIPEISKEEVVTAAVYRLMEGDYRDRISSKIIDLAAEHIKLSTDALVAEALQEPIQRTSRYGEPEGQAVTLRGMIIDDAKKWLTEKVSGNNRRESGIQSLIRETVRDAMQKELKSEVDSVVKSVRDGIKAEFAGAIEKSVADLIRRPLV